MCPSCLVLSKVALARKSLVLLEDPLNILPMQHSYEPSAVGVAAVPRYEKAADLAETLDDFVEEEVGAGGRWAELHTVLRRSIGISLPAIAAKPAEHDPALVDDDAHVVPRSSDAITNLAQPFVRPAGGDVFARSVDDAPPPRRSALEREAVDRPVSLPADVIVHAGEPEAFEPRRGPWADISVAVVAVDDKRRVLR